MLVQMGRRATVGGEVCMAVSWFRVARYLKLPDHYVVFWNLLPAYFTIQEFQMLIVIAKNLRLVTGWASWDSPLYCWLKTIEKVLGTLSSTNIYIYIQQIYIYIYIYIFVIKFLLFFYI